MKAIDLVCSSLVVLLVAVVGLAMLAGCSVAHADGPAFLAAPCVVEDPARPPVARLHADGVGLDRLARSWGALCIEQRPGAVACFQVPLAVSNGEAVAVCSLASKEVPADRWTLRVYLGAE